MQLNGLGASSLGATGSTQWFKSSPLKLNNVFPSLVHQYDKGRYYNSVTGQTGFPFTATRTTNAMQYDSQGRLVWAPANMYNRSNLMTDSGWNKNGSVVNLASGISSPTGDSVFKLIVNNGVSTIGNDAVGGVWQIITGLSNNAPVCFSFYAKSAEDTAIRIRENVSTGVRVNINLTNGTIVYETGSSVQMQCYANPVGDGWYRINCTYILGATATTTNFEIKGGADTGDGVSGTYISSPQHEMWGVDSPKSYCSSGTSVSAIYKERYDYSPTIIGEMRGLLIEGAGQNFLPRSSTVAANWESASYATPTNAGTQWGFPVVKLTTNSLVASQFSYIAGNTLTPTIATQYVISAFVKKDNYRYCQMTPSANFTGNPPGGVWLNYDFDTNTYQQGGTDAVAGSGYAEVLNDGWVRLQIAFLTTSASGGAGIIFSFPNSLADTRLVTCSTLGASYFVFGCQAESYQIATSHVPTYGASVTRTGDQFLLTPIPWINQSFGTVFVKYVPNKNDNTNLRRIFDISDGTANNRVQLARTSGRAVSAVTSLAGVSDFSPGTATTSSDFAVAKAAIEYIPGDKRVVLNGGTLGTNTNTSVPTSGMTTLIMGSVTGFPTGNTLGGWIQEFRYYPTTSASDAQLQALTA